MPRIIISPIARWPGTVTLSDPLTFPQYLTWKRGLEEANGQAGHDLLIGESGIAENAVYLLPGLCACVEAWELQNFPAQVTPDTFPSTPRLESGQLVIWLVNEIRKIVMGEEQIPNG